jgi:predicted lipoprotein with Yx(FWY)xxD motif
MKMISLLLGATAALATLTACGGGGAQEAAGNPPAASGAVSVQDVEGLGQTLVDPAGKTLYFADQEADGAIKCTASCLSFWFPVEGTDSTAKSMDGLAVVKRSDNGMSQLTFEGKPLYTFKLDTGAGQSKGNNLTDEFAGTTFVWHAATTSGAAPTQAPSEPDYGY